MASSSSRRVVHTQRDQQILAAIDRCPLTSEQLLKLSVTFGEDRFATIDAVQKRLRKLKDAGWVRSWRYATTSRGSAPEYFRLSPTGFRLLHGPDMSVPAKRHFSEIAVAHHHHTQSLSELIVHLFVAARLTGIRVVSFYRENSFKLEAGNDSVWPDGALELERDGDRFYFLLELDNSTKSLTTPANLMRASNDRDADTIERTARVYHAVRSQTGTRFRVLYVTTRSSDRFRNILDVASTVSPDKRRALFYGIDLARLLAEPDPLTSDCFFDRRGDRQPLLPQRQAVHRGPRKQTLAMAAPI